MVEAAEAHYTEYAIEEFLVRDEPFRSVAFGDDQIAFREALTELDEVFEIV